MDSIKQAFFIADPPLTEKNLPDQEGKVHIVTGGYAGCGQELVKILYERNATVYVAGRSQEKANKTIQSTQNEFPNSKGKLTFMNVDLSDLTTIKPAVDDFLSKESRLDVLTNNAGVMYPPAGSKTKQDHDLTFGTNVIGPFLLSKLLLPILQKTAATAPAGSVRVTWASSIVASARSPTGGVTFDERGEVDQTLPSGTLGSMYGQSKAANNLLAAESARRYGKDGIISVSWNPGNLKTELPRHKSSMFNVLISPILYPARNGAYTELYAGWSTDITAEQNGAYVAPWGRVTSMPKHIELANKTAAAGGTGQAEKLWEWCDKTTAQYQ